MANHIKPRRKQLGLTQQAIADQIGTTKATVMKLEKGDMQLTEIWMRRLSGPLQCRPEDLIADHMPEDVPLIGEVDGQGVVQLFRPLPVAGAAEAADYWSGLEVVERPPETGHRHVRALRLVQEAMEPLLPSGSIVYYAERIMGGFDEFENKLVVCGLAGGGVFLRRLRPGSEFNRYHLVAADGDRLENIELAWLAKVIFLKLD